MTDSARPRFRLPHWGWFLLVVVVLVVTGLGFASWLSSRHEEQVMTPAKLYRDSEIEAIHERFGGKDRPHLNLVPDGETMTLKRIFQELGLNPTRLGEPQVNQRNMVKFYEWRVSPGYELSVMVATNDRHNDFSDLWNVNGYGLRIARK